MREGSSHNHPTGSRTNNEACEPDDSVVIRLAFSRDIYDSKLRLLR